MRVPLFATSLDPYLDRIEAKLAEVARSGSYILGPEVGAFEEEFARYLGARHAIGVANGTDALTIALRALGVAPGDEVVCPSLTFYATAEAVVNAGARPVFCDIDPQTFCVTAETVKPHLSDRTAAVIAVHLFGNVAPIPELMQLEIPVLEDAAQAAGASLEGRKAGALGDAATFSFFPSKNLPCLGDGGAVVTDSEEVAAKVRLLRFHGSEDKVTHTDVGYNSRLDSMQAAVLRILLPELDDWTASRQAVADLYREHVVGDRVQLPVPAPGATHAYHLFVALADSPDSLAAELNEAGIEARGYYRTPAHRQPAMAQYSGADLPVTDEVAKRNLALPMGPELARGQVEAVAASFGGSPVP